MFLLTRDAERGRRTLERLRAALAPLRPGPLVGERAGSHWLGWFRARRSDNLHAFRDGFVVGKLAPGEEACESTIAHPGSLPEDGHPLARAVAIDVTGGTPRVRPRHWAAAYFDADSASDMQLLLADLNGRRPGGESVALLAGVGYFPGDLTLFSEVRRIPYLHSLALGETPRREALLPSRAPDDGAMIERLTALLPPREPSVLAISGGCDSRFVLGILRRAGVSPELVRLSDSEDAVAARLAAEARLPMRVVDAPEPAPPPGLYALMTDAQIYSGGGHYARLRGALTPGALCYLGLFADSILKNAFRAAWKNPLAPGGLEDRLIREALLSRIREREPGLRRAGRREELVELLRPELRGTWEHGELRGPKQRANWFYFVHRGLRWTAAHTADLDFFGEVALPLSDLEATANGLRSSAWSNFHNARVRRMNHALLPGISTGYANGQPVEASSGPLAALERVYYEFGARGLKHLRERRRVGAPSTAGPASSPADAPEEAPGLSAYFDRSLPALLSDPACGGTVRRAAVTVNEALRYLSGGTPSGASDSGGRLAP